MDVFDWSALAEENSCVIVISDFDGGSHLQRV